MTPTGWITYALDADPVVTIHAPPERERDTERAIDAIWSEATGQNPRLYNGRVFCATRFGGSTIAGHWEEYRVVFAQMRRPELYGHLKLRPLAVTGLFRCADGVVIGRRSREMSYLGGFWQSVPAGSVEAREASHAVDLRQQLLHETGEELGISPEDVTVGRTLLVCEHAGTHIVDVGFDIRTSLPFSAIERRWRQHGNSEYDLLRCIRQPFVASDMPDLLPTTVEMAKVALR